MFVNFFASDVDHGKS